MFPVREQFVGRDPQGGVWTWSALYALETMALEASTQDNFPLFIKGTALEEGGQTVRVAPQAAYTFNSQGVIELPVGNVANLVVTPAGGGNPYFAGTDYTLDAINGIVTQKAGGAITSEALYRVLQLCGDRAKCWTATSLARLPARCTPGSRLWPTTYGTMGFFAKILIAPGYSQDAAAASALLSTALTIRAIALIDSPPSISPATAIANRGVAGNVFDTSSDRAVLCYPQEKFFDLGLIPAGVTLNSAGTPVQNAANVTAVGPYSPWVAGTIAAKDLQKGYGGRLPIPQVIGPLGPDVTLYALAPDAASDVNNLKIFSRRIRLACCPPARPPQSAEAKGAIHARAARGCRQS